MSSVGSGVTASIGSNSNSATPATLESKILYIQTSMDPKLRLILNADWGAQQPNYRQNIRSVLSSKFSNRFSREQLAMLNDLNWIPRCSDGFVSISHCKALGGFSFSQLPHGFDVEEKSRISLEILNRTCSEVERAECGENMLQRLWVAKESGLKAHSAGYRQQSGQELLLTDLICTGWQSHFENQIFSFRLTSEKTLEFTHNRGFIFQHDNCLFSLYFC